LTVGHVEAAVAGGARRPKEIYQAAGCTADCGTCTGAVLCLLRKVLAEHEDAANLMAGAD
jgi:bacterioferritin-associated ferredoxin